MSEAIPIPEPSELEVLEEEFDRSHSRKGSWAEEDGRYKANEIRIRPNKKSQDNTLDPVKGCFGGSLNVIYDDSGAPEIDKWGRIRSIGCHWGCYAAYKAYTQGVDYTIPVPQILNEERLRKDLQRMTERFPDINWVRMGVMGDPAGDWDTTVEVCHIVADESNRLVAQGKRTTRIVPVVMTRLWGAPPSEGHLRMLEDSGTMLHITICALDSDPFLERRERVCKAYLSFGGTVIWRVVTFYFDPHSERGVHLWQRQDELISGRFGMISDKVPGVLEVPARMMSFNPTWESGEIFNEAYYHAPTTREHLENRYNHWWTAGPLYPESDHCWMGCHDCPNQCMTVLEGE